MVSRSGPRDPGGIRRQKCSRPAGTTERGQAFTLEAFVASLLLLTAVVVVLGSTSVTPLSAGGSGPQVGTQQAAIADGSLDAAAANGSLRPAVLFWNETAADGGEFHNVSDEGDYPSGGPPNEFGRLLNRTFEDRDIAFMVNVRYVAENGSVMTRPMVNMGEPTDTGVRAVEWLTLYDDDRLYAANGTRTNVTIGNSTTEFYAPDVRSGPVYNVVRVEVIAWRV